MKKFNIIEEGRLSLSEMNQVVGGELNCTGTYCVVNCQIEGMSSFSSCPGSYFSCVTGSGLLTCNGGYGGPTGPGGIQTTIPGVNISGLAGNSVSAAGNFVSAGSSSPVAVKLS